MITLFAQAVEHHSNDYFLPGDINEFYWGTAAFLVLVALYIWKGHKPLVKVMRGRTERIEGEITEASSLRQAALADLEEVRAGLGNADQAAAEIREEAVARAETVAAELRARADTDVASERDRARIEIEALRAQATADLREDVAARAAEAAEAVVRENLDDAAKSRLIDRYIEQVGAS